MYLCNKVTKESTLVDLSGASQKPILSLIMDQGRCGTAFAGYLAGTGCSLIHYGFLGCNLGINVICNNPLSHACGNRFIFLMVNSVGPIYDETDSGWDPLHRLINDMKHAMTFGPKDGTHWLGNSTFVLNLCLLLELQTIQGLAASMQTSESFWTISLRTMTEDHSDLNSTFPESALV